MDMSLRCSASGCHCNNFIGTKEEQRICDSCTHSWLTHLLERLVRNDEALSVLDVCSLALYGTQALPIRLKIVIERLLGTLAPEEIDKILRTFGWTPMDLARGYMINVQIMSKSFIYTDRDGLPLIRWSILPREEEPIILEQFRRFRSTHSLTLALLKKELPSWSEVEEETERSLEGEEEMENYVLNLSSSVCPSSRTSESIEMSSDDDESGGVVDLSIKSETPISPPLLPKGRERDSRSLVRNGLSLLALLPQTENTNLNPHPNLNNGEKKRNSSGSPPNERKPNWTLPPPTLINGPNGKRRVECSVCHKTFCDKGALKIHYSAVHLKEQHKCTVSGCSMMFSSRRSRNRHSSNPNPKLHSPHMRRKISPHDGRTCQPAINFDPNNPIFNSFTNNGPTNLKSEECSVSPVGYEEIRKNGARKRKLCNPMRVQNSPERESCHEEMSQNNPISTGRSSLSSPHSDSHSPPSSEPITPLPLHALASKVFNFSSHFQNLHLNGINERWAETLFGIRPRLDFLLDARNIPIISESPDERDIIVKREIS